MLIPGKPNVSYICSRYYRAPELIFGSRDYTCAIDLWSMVMEIDGGARVLSLRSLTPPPPPKGCVMAELYIGQPLFPGESGVDQLVEVIKVRCARRHRSSSSVVADSRTRCWARPLRTRSRP